MRSARVTAPWGDLQGVRSPSHLLSRLASFRRLLSLLPGDRLLVTSKLQRSQRRDTIWKNKCAEAANGHDNARRLSLSSVRHTLQLVQLS